MTAYNRVELARAAYGAYESGDRSVLEDLLAEDFTFYSPYDVGIDRATYFERCWPNAELIDRYHFIRLVASRDVSSRTHSEKATSIWSTSAAPTDTSITTRSWATRTARASSRRSRGTEQRFPISASRSRTRSASTTRSSFAGRARARSRTS